MASSVASESELRYTYFTAVQREQVNEMLERFPSNLKIAYIDHNHLVENGDRDVPWPPLSSLR